MAMKLWETQALIAKDSGAGGQIKVQRSRKRKQQKQRKGVVKGKAKSKARAKGKAKSKAKAKARPQRPRTARPVVRRFARRTVKKAAQRAGKQNGKRKAQGVQDWDGSSENASPNPSDVEKLLGGPSQISRNLAPWIAKQLQLDVGCVAGAVQLFQEGSTLPFIARYRKEKTGSMTEEDLRRVEREICRVKDLEKRRGRVAVALNRGRNLTPNVLESLLQAETMEELEELWAPFKAKRQTRAQMAKEKGLEPLAAFLQECAKGELSGVAPVPVLSVPVIDLCNDGAELPPVELPPAEAPAPAETPAAQLAAAAELPPMEVAAQFIGKDVPDVATALAAARDILAEQLAHRPDLRQVARDMLQKRVTLTSRRRSGGDAQEEQRFKTYWEFDAPMHQVKPHQFLAIQRGEGAKCLSLGFLVSSEDTQHLIDQLIAVFLGKPPRQTPSSLVAAPTPLRARPAGLIPRRGKGAYQMEIRTAMEDGFKRLMLPSLQREWRSGSVRKLKERAEDEAFDTFGRNLKKKLLSPPLRLHPEWGSDALRPTTAIIGVDPAFRTGCKCALISLTGQVLATKTIFPHPHMGAEVASSAAQQGLMEMLEQAMLEGGANMGEEPPSKRRRTATCCDVAGGDESDALEEVPCRVVCSIGNGTASRETEAWLRKQFADHKGLGYAIVDEAGASVYSASPLAAAELPDLDVCLRGAVSIARRLLDPLAELVKIDPRSIGVGLYQHDVDQKRLAEELRGAAMSCVNAVGVDLNTASPALLEHVAGLNGRLARRMAGDG
eukprot:s3213_g3.t1